VRVVFCWLCTGVYPCAGSSWRAPAVQSQQIDASSPRLVRRRQLPHVHGRRLHDLLRSAVVSRENTIRCLSFKPAEFITFRVSRRRRKMHSGHGRLCVCLSVCLSLAAFPHYCTDLDVTWGNDKGYPLVVGRFAVGAGVSLL